MAGKRNRKASAGGGLGCLALVIIIIVAVASGGGKSTNNTAAGGIGGDTSIGTDSGTSTTTDDDLSTSGADTTVPTQAPVGTAAPTATPAVLRTDTCGAPPNPWGYGFCHGSDVYSVPAGFCEYFRCIPSFGDSSGYIVECNDGDYSNAGGRRGACSYHDGEKRALLNP